MVTFAEYYAQQLRDDRTALRCAGLCRRRKARREFRETPWHGRAAACKFCDHYADERKHTWELEQARGRTRALRMGLEKARQQRDAQAARAASAAALARVSNGYSFRYAELAHRARAERDEAREAVVTYRAEVRRLQDEFEEREYFHAWTSDREIPADVERETKRRTATLETSLRAVTLQFKAAIARRDRHNATVNARFTAIESIARALEDALPGDQWHAAHALRRLATGEITPDEALKEAWPGE